MYSARIALDGMEVDDTDFLRRVAGRVETGTSNARRRAQVPMDARGADDGTAVESDGASALAEDARSVEDGEVGDVESPLVSSHGREGVGHIVEDVVGGVEDEESVEQEV